MCRKLNKHEKKNVQSLSLQTYIDSCYMCCGDPLGVFALQKIWARLPYVTVAVCIVRHLYSNGSKNGCTSGVLSPSI